MTREGRKYIIKVLFTISFAFLSTGFYIELSDRLSYTDPRNTASSVEYDKVTITPADKNDVLGFVNVPSGGGESIDSNTGGNTGENTGKNDNLSDNTGGSTGGNTGGGSASGGIAYGMIEGHHFTIEDGSTNGKLTTTGGSVVGG